MEKREGGSREVPGHPLAPSLPIWRTWGPLQVWPTAAKMRDYWWEAAGPVLGRSGRPPGAHAAARALDRRRAAEASCSGCQAGAWGLSSRRGLGRAAAFGPHRCSSRQGTAGSGVAQSHLGTCLPAAPPLGPAPALPGGHFSSRRPGNRCRQLGVTWGGAANRGTWAARSILGGKAGTSGTPGANFLGGGSKAKLAAGGRTLRGRVSASTLHRFAGVHFHGRCSWPCSWPSSGEEPEQLNT